MLLNDSWTMLDGDSRYPCSVPCSAMQVLYREGVIPDPYYRENEWISTPVSERDFAFERTFVPEEDLLRADQALLVFEGIDTLGRVFLNGKEVFVSKAKSPTRADGVRVKVQLKKGRNRLLVKTASANPRSWFVFLRFMTGKQPLMPPSAKPAVPPAPSKNTPPAKPAGTPEKASPAAAGK